MKTKCCGLCLMPHKNVRLEIDQAGNEFVQCDTHKERIYLKHELNSSNVLNSPIHKWEPEMRAAYNPKIGT
jgi:hypothetical protein